MTNDTVGLCPNILLFHIYNGFWYIWWGLVGLVGGGWGGVLFVWWVLFVGLIARLFLLLRKLNVVYIYVYIMFNSVEAYYVCI